MAAFAFPVPLENLDPGQSFIEWQACAAGTLFSQWQTCLAGMPIKDFKLVLYTGLAMQGLLAASVGETHRSVDDLVQRAFEIGTQMAAH